METKTLINFKKQLIKKLPFFPNDRATASHLESLKFFDVLLHYLHWQTRLIPVRTRKITLLPEVTADKRWHKVKLAANKLFDEIRAGNDLTPYLSNKVHTHGYTPLIQSVDGAADSWIDKDQILNVMGFHHLHLGLPVLQAGSVQRTNEVLFVRVNRQEVHAIGIFDHSVFDSNLDVNGMLNPERDRLWRLHEKYMTIGMSPGSFYLNSLISTSGHPVDIVRLADFYKRIIFEYDKELSQISFVQKIYQNTLINPIKFNFEWQFHNLDLCLFDKKNNYRFILYEGFI